MSEAFDHLQTMSYHTCPSCGQPISNDGWHNCPGTVYVNPIVYENNEAAKLRTRLELMRFAVKEMAEYFEHNCLNFQYEKMKDYVNNLKRLSEPE